MRVGGISEACVGFIGVAKFELVDAGDRPARTEPFSNSAARAGLKRENFTRAKRVYVSAGEAGNGRDNNVSIAEPGVVKAWCAGAAFAAIAGKNERDGLVAAVGQREFQPGIDATRWGFGEREDGFDFRCFPAAYSSEHKGTSDNEKRGDEKVAHIESIPSYRALD